ncbi:MAG: EFR1 family ferrodoxin [Lachnospiraceae bacterium]|nr:EFR1 family ferrodoxin [Lachnospiraceae bacterium]
MTGIYFSATGNSRYAVETFCREYDKKSNIISIEDSKVFEAIKEDDTIVFAYPVQFSTVPRMVRDFVMNNRELWKDKKVFVIATMGLFSGDGAGQLGRLIKKCDGKIIGGLHLKMPDSVADEKALKRPLEENIKLVNAAKAKIISAVNGMKENNPPKEGLNFFYQMAGLFGQRLYFGHKTRNYTSKLKINKELCIGCGKCERLCPMDNIKTVNGKAVAGEKCTMCYRCINMCPNKAVTLLGKRVVEQTVIEKYIK